MCDWADLPAEAVQDYTYDMLATPDRDYPVFFATINTALPLPGCHW